LDRFEEDIGIGQIIRVFHASGKIPVESDKLNKHNKAGEITNLKFFFNMLGIKSGP